MVFKARRQKRRRHPGLAVFREKQKLVFGHGGVQGCALFGPVGQQFLQATGVDDGARQNMPSNFCCLFDKADRELGTDGLAELFGANSRSQTGRPTSDNYKVIVNSISLHGNPLHYRLFFNSSGRSPLYPFISLFRV